MENTDDAGLKGTVLQKVLEKKAQALKAPTAPPPPPPVQLQQQPQQSLQQQQKSLPMQMTGMHHSFWNALRACEPPCRLWIPVIWYYGRSKPICRWAWTCHNDKAQRSFMLAHAFTSHTCAVMCQSFVTLQPEALSALFLKGEAVRMVG